MVLRHRRDVEAIAEELKANRRIAKEAARPTGTEINLTTDTVAGMATDVEDAKEQAQQAIEDAANALTTSNGKNSRRRGQTEPEPPAGGWAQGDQWIVDNGDGKPVEVRVWDGDEFVFEQVLAAELLVVSGGGVVRLADGVVTADAIAADAIDGMIITGALIRTAATGMRLELTPDGLEAFNAADAKVATLFASSGGLAIDGTMQARAGDATYERTADMRGEQMTVGTFRVGADYVSTVGMIPGIGSPGIAAHIYPDVATGTHHKDAGLSADSSGAHVRLRRYLPDDSDYSSLVMQLLNDKSARIWSTDGPLLVLAQEGPITLRSETDGVVVDGPTEFQGQVQFAAQQFVLAQDSCLGTSSITTLSGTNLVPVPGAAALAFNVTVDAPTPVRIELEALMNCNSLLIVGVAASGATTRTIPRTYTQHGVAFASSSITAFASHEMTLNAGTTTLQLVAAGQGAAGARVVEGAKVRVLRA